MVAPTLENEHSLHTRDMNHDEPPSGEERNNAGVVKDSYWVEALAQGLAVLHAFDSDRPLLTLSQIATRLEWPRAKPYRFVHTLEKMGYLQRDESGRAFRLTSRSMQLGFAYLSRLPLVERAQPVLDRLRAEVGASVHMALLEGAELVYVAAARMQLPTAINIHVGSRVPAYATSIGRVLLAYKSDEEIDVILGTGPLPALTQKTTVNPAVLHRNLKLAREQGYVFNDEEFHAGVRSIACAIFDAKGEAVAGINATAATYLFTDERVRDEIVPAVLRVADDISRGLGGALSSTDKGTKVADASRQSERQARVT